MIALQHPTLIEQVGRLERDGSDVLLNYWHRSEETFCGTGGLQGNVNSLFKDAFFTITTHWIYAHLFIFHICKYASEHPLYPASEFISPEASLEQNICLLARGKSLLAQWVYLDLCH